MRQSGQCVGEAFTGNQGFDRSAGYLAPDLSITPAALPGRVHYIALNVILSSRALLPEPECRQGEFQ